MTTDFDWDAAIRDQRNWTPVKYSKTSPLARRNGCPYGISIQGEMITCGGKLDHYGIHSLSPRETRGKPNLTLDISTPTHKGDQHE